MFVLEYDGTDFQGWQRQRRSSRTIQGTLEAAISDLIGREIVVTGAGRTDSGVHAQGQVASAEFDFKYDTSVLRRAVNARLPDDLRVLECDSVSKSFHPRKDAVEKHYRYRVWNGSELSPLVRRFVYHVPIPLGISPMRQAAVRWLGRHDFKSFETTGSFPATTERTLRSFEIRGRPGQEICFEIRGDGFLRHMIRNMIGTLILIGLGRRPSSEAERVLLARDRSAAGPAAPAKGLVLMSVYYGNLCLLESLA